MKRRRRPYRDVATDGSATPQSTDGPLCSPERAAWADCVGQLVALHLRAGNHEGATRAVADCREMDPDVGLMATDLSVQQRYDLSPAAAGFCERTSNFLEEAGIVTLGQLAEKTRHQIQTIPGIALKTVSEIDGVFHRLEIKWHGRDRPERR